MRVEEAKSIAFVMDFIKKHTKNVTRITERYAKYDILADDVFIEVKHRRCDVNKFNNYCNNGFILENSKYEFLKDKPSRYVNTFDVNDVRFMFIWDIKNVVPNVESMISRVETDPYGNSRINMKYRSKEVILLYPADAKVICYINKGYELITLKQLIDRIDGNNI